MNGKILEEVYNRNAPYSDRIRIPFLFQGQYYDHETELAYNRFRYYSPELGRYISEDPIGLDGGPLALSSYVKDSNLWIDYLGLTATHLHHTIPREIYTPRSGKNPLLPGHLINDPDIKGRPGNQNRWRLPADEHTNIHKRNRFGGDYNTRWREELALLDPDKTKWTKQDILAIRDKLTKEFGIDKYKPGYQKK